MKRVGNIKRIVEFTPCSIYDKTAWIVQYSSGRMFTYTKLPGTVRAAIDNGASKKKLNSVDPPIYEYCTDDIGGGNQNEENQ